MSDKEVKLINEGDFCTIVSDKLGEAGLNEGDVVFVAGLKDLPFNEDPYNRRIYFIVVETVNSHVNLKTEKFPIVDPRSLELVSDEENERLKEIFEADVKAKEDEDEGSN